MHFMALRRVENILVLRFLHIKKTVNLWQLKQIPSSKLQSWTKVLGTVMQYAYFCVALGSLIKQCIFFKIFHSSPYPTLYKLKLGKNSGYTRHTLFVG